VDTTTQAIMTTRWEHRLIDRHAAAAIQALNAAGGGDTTTAAVFRNIVDTTTPAIMTARWEHTDL
jgi:hypothetical protein